MIALDTLLVLSAALAIDILRTSSSTPSSPALQTVADIALTGGLPKFDQQSLDTTTKLLFITHSGGNDVIVFDTSARKVVRHIAGISHPHGILVIPELGRVYVSDSFDNQVYVIDERAFRVISRIPVGQKPDVITYNPDDHKLFISDELGHSDTVIDPRTEQRIATIPLAGEVGNTRYDPVSHRIFAAIQTLNQFVAIDPVSDRVVAHYALPDTCKHDHGLLLDVSQRLAFLECDVSATVVLLDLQSMKALSTQTVGANPDLMAFDAARHLLYVSSRSGLLSIFDGSGRTLRKVYEKCVASNAHSISVNPETHEIYMICCICYT